MSSNINRTDDIAKIMGGLIVSEGTVSRNVLRNLLAAIQESPSALSTLAKALECSEPLELEKNPEEDSKDIFEQVINICASEDMNPDSINYLENCSKSLGIESEAMEDLIRTKISRSSRIRQQASVMHHFLDSKQHRLQYRNQKGITRLIAGAILADGTISDKERPYLESMEKALSSHPIALKEFNAVIEENKPLRTFNTIKISHKEGEKVLKCIVEICMSDFQLHPDEMEYIYKTSKVLNVSSVRTQEMIENSSCHSKKEHIKKLDQILNTQGKRAWFSSIILKMIYMDNQDHVHRQDFIFLKDAHVFLGAKGDRTANVKKSAENLGVWELSQKFWGNILDKGMENQAHAETILRYLLIIATNDLKCDVKKIGMLQQVAGILQFDHDTLKTLITRRLIGLFIEEDLELNLKEKEQLGG